jgi:hypothetical protein
MGVSFGLGVSALLPAGLGFRNLLINGDFRINQRGLTSSGITTSTYGFDRWSQSTADGTATYSAQTFSVGNVISGQEPTNHARVVTTGQTLSSAVTRLYQPIENVRTCAGQQIVVSFWAKAASGTPKVAIELQQNFGSGGSPSSTVSVPFGQATLSTSWQRFTLTGFVPSISGKTIGTNNDHALMFFMYVSAGSNYATPTGSLGIQSNTFDLWGVQLEQNYSSTPFEQRPIGVELALCQRYYEKSYENATAPGTSTFTRLVTMPGSAGSATTGEIIGNYYWAAVKRVAPTVAWYDHSGNSNRVTRLQYGVANHANNVASAGTVTEVMAVVSSTSGNTGQSLQFHFVADVEL